MVRVVSVHHFDSQIIQTCDEPLAVASAPPDRLLVALPHHVVEVKDLNANGDTIFSFPTVDQVCYLEHSLTGSSSILVVKLLNDYVNSFCFCTESPPELKKQKVSKPGKRKESKNSVHLSEVLKYYSSSEFFKAEKYNINPKFIEKVVKFPEALYLMDPVVAKKISDTIKEDLCKDNVLVFEANPGLGVLTKELLKTNISKLHLFEGDSCFKSRLLNLEDSNPGRLKVNCTNLFNIWKLAYQDKLDNGSRVDEIMEGVEKRSWEEGPAVKIIGALPNVRFVKHILFSMISQNSLITYGRPELYVLSNPQNLIKLNFIENSNPCRPSTVFFSLFFNFDCIESFDRKAFLPWQYPSVQPKPDDIRNLYNMDPDKMYLVKVSLREDMYDIVPLAYFKPFWFFVKHNLRTRKNRVIGEMEKWVPGCGPRLINQGLGVFTEFGDLSAKQFLRMFIEFTKWPEFETCPFLAAMESTSLEMDGAED